MRFISTLVVTVAVLAVAQVAVAQLTTIPITVTSQTLRVEAFGSTTGDVVGGSSVGTSWNFGDVNGSTSGAISSVLTNGELVITIDGVLSDGAAAGGVEIEFRLDPISFEFVVPDSLAPIFLQLTRVNTQFIGPVEYVFLEMYPDWPWGYSSQLLGGLASLGYTSAGLSPSSTSIAAPLNGLIPNDTIGGMRWEVWHRLQVNVDNSTGTFDETYTLRVVTYLPEPSASLTIPSGAAMLLALTKLRGVSLIR